MPRRFHGLHTIARLAFRNLLRHRRRSLNALLAVSFGCIALVLSTGFIESMFLDFREATIESNVGHLQITRPGFHEEGRSDPDAYLLPPDGDGDLIKGTVFPRSLAPRLMLTGLVSHRESTLSFMGDGIDPSKDMTDDRALQIIEGKRLSSDSQGEVLLGQGLATLLDVHVGDTVVLLVNTQRGGINARDARVAGIFASVSKAYDESALLVPLQTARALLRTNGAHSWLVYLNKTEATDDAAGLLRNTLDPRKFEVRTWDQMAEFYTKAVELLRDQLGVVRVIVIVIILLSISNTMMMTVMERTSEIGTVMALGTKARGVWGQFVAEGALIGVIGGIVGVVLAIVLGRMIGALGIEMPPPPSMTRGYIANILITVPIVLEAIAISIVTTFVASMYPAWKASRMNIVDAIRYSR